MAEPAIEITDHWLPATMTPTHVSLRESEAACLIIRRSVNQMCIITTQQKTWLQVFEYVKKLGALQARVLKPRS
jgi:hypothetical protein